MNAPAHKSETAEEIVKRIMKDPVPMQGQLIHPIKKIDKKKEPTNLDMSKKFPFPLDINLWTPKMFVDYFAQKYNEETGGNYRKVYRSDMMLVQQIGDFLVSNGMERNYWTKRLLDWSVKHKDEIIRRERHFTLQEVLRQVNYFYQQEVLPKVEEDEIERDTQDTLLLEEIQKADEDGKITEVLIRFGIPVTITYLVNFRNVPLEKIIKATEDRLSSLSGGSILEKKQLEKIAQSSVIGSPYPAEFLCLDWRDLYSLYIGKYHKELWWRFEDYKGKPLQKYYSLV